MPEYEMFPQGMWHMLGAVMLMVFSTAMVVMVATWLLSHLLNTEIPPAIEFGGLALMGVVLTTPTFLLSRGWSKCQHFLRWLNAFYLLVLTGGVFFSFMEGDYVHVFIGLIGIGCAVGARLLYGSGAYRTGVEYYRLIWAHYRAGTMRKSIANTPSDNSCGGG